MAKFINIEYYYNIMGRRKIDKKKLDEDFRRIIKTEHEVPKADQKLYVYERPIYHSARQYVVKIPAKIFDFFEYSKGDKLKFILDITDIENPKISIEYDKLKNDKI